MRLLIVDLDGLLQEDGSKRAKALRDATEQRLTGKAATALRDAVEPVDIEAALDSKVDRDATPTILPRGIPILQPTSERRRSGSHYTPRTLTEPIVSEALQPIFDRLGTAPKPRDILELKILDPATGSRCVSGRSVPSIGREAARGLGYPRRPVRHTCR